MSAVRTVKNGQRYLERWDWLVVSCWAILIPSIVGFVFLQLTEMLNDAEILPSAILSILMSFGFQAFAPVFTVFLVPVACFIALLFLKLGWAGWAIAVGLPLALVAAYLWGQVYNETAFSRSVYFEPLIFLNAAMSHGLIMWLVLRWRRPEALAAR